MFRLIVLISTLFVLTNAQKSCDKGIMAKELYYNVQECMENNGNGNSSSTMSTSTESNKKNSENNQDSKNMSTMDCRSKCIHTKRGLFDEQGRPQTQKVREVLTDLQLQLDDKMMAGLVGRIENCLDNEGSKAKSEDCESYRPFCKCVALSFMDEICGKK